MIKILTELIEILFQLISIAFKRWYNLCVKGKYLIDDEDTNRLISFLIKVAQNSNYKPTDTEQEFEQELLETYRQVIEQNPGLTEENYPYQKQRQGYALEELRVLQNYAKIKEDK